MNRGVNVKTRRKEYLSLLKYILLALLQILPDGSHPDCAMQLTHAAGELRRPEALELQWDIRPMRTKFS